MDTEAAFTVPVTVAERRVLTPEYAAPEQVRGEPPTTATDVYGLGVLLYELLTGTRPYQVDERVRRVVEQAILEAEPTEPSTAVTDAREAAEARATEPHRLRRRLRGDLDRIVLKALRKEPDRRYDGPAALVADVRRHLDGLPVEARPESAAYRLSRFVRRHRAGVVAASMVLLAILGGAGVAFVQAEAARAERDRAEAVTDLLVGLFDGGDPAVAQGDTLTALALLDSASARLGVSLADEPALRSRLQLALSRIYTQQGAFERGDSLLAPALAWSRQSGDDEALADALFQSGEIHFWFGTYAEAEAAHREGLALARRLGRPTRDLVRRMREIALARQQQGDYPGARALYEEALATLRAEVPADDLDIGRSLSDLAVVDHYDGEYTTSVKRFRESLAILESALGQGHPEVVMRRRELAWSVGAGGDPEEAVRILEEVQRANLALYGENHPTVPNTYGEISRFRRESGDLDGAEVAAQEALRVVRQLYPDGHQYVGSTLLDVTTVLRERGRYAEGQALAEEALQIYHETLGPEHMFAGVAHGHLARLGRLQGDWGPALRHEREALRIFEARLGPDHAYTDSSRARLARTEAWLAAN
ncbi:MAG: tetratricopeptide repeat-containing protein kinase family protein [Bacteroidota bacterium]